VTKIAIPRPYDLAIGWAASLVLLVSALATPASGQYADARLVPKGVLRIGFEPRYLSYRERFDANGSTEPLGTDFSDSTAGVRLFPTLAEPQTALRSILTDPLYAVNLGVFRTIRDADIRRFPLTLRFGLSDRISLTARVPLVTTRSQVDFSVDSAAGDMGWNQLAEQSGNSVAAQQAIQTLFAELEAGAAAVDARIAAGDFGCPSSPECDDARAAVADARQLVLGLAVLAGVDAGGTPGAQITPFAPLTASEAGTGLLAAIQDVSTRLVQFGASPLTATYPLPSAPIGAGGVNEMLADSAYGYASYPLQFSKYSLNLGDIELGMRFGVFQSDEPDHFLDIGTGDRQLDVEVGLEGAWEPGSFLGLAGSASYNLQLGHQLVRRVTRHTAPIAPLAARTTVKRNLGDELRASVYPSLRLSPSFTVYGTAAYYRRSADNYALAGNPSDGQPLDASELAFETSMSSWSFGAGIHYYSRGRTGRGMPIEAGIDYRAAFSGNGGQTPKYASVSFYLRLHWRLLGGTAQPAEPPAPAVEPESVPEPEPPARF
jgi:hypothetical protein